MPPRRAAQMCRPYEGCRSGYTFFVGAGPRMARRPRASYHLRGKTRRGIETAVLEIFLPPRAQWPGGNLDTHSDFHAPEILLILTGVRLP